MFRVRRRPSRWRYALPLIPLLALWQVMVGAADLQGLPGPAETVVPAVRERVAEAVAGIAAAFGRLAPTPGEPGAAQGSGGFPGSSTVGDSSAGTDRAAAPAGRLALAARWMGAAARRLYGSAREFGAWLGEEWAGAVGYLQGLRGKPVPYP